jgi:Ni,Fe-hydrogenase III small subunit
MIKILRQILRTGIITEQFTPDTSSDIQVVGAKLGSAIRKKLRGSLAIRQVDAGSCNGCELEIHAINNGIYNCEQFGVHFTASPRFADMLLVTGPVTFNMQIALQRTYNATPAPKLVVAVGDCACNGGIFGSSYASIGGVDKVIPVHTRIGGCPPTPLSILEGILKTLD